MTAPLTLPETHRLMDKAAFDRVFEDARRSADRYFTVLASDNAVAHPRLGMVVSRKVSARAVTRNRIRRTVRESFRLNQHGMRACDLVVLARPDARGASNHELRESLDSHWRRAAS